MAFNKLYKVLISVLAKAASFDSEIFDIQDMSGFSVQAKWTDKGSLAGSIKLQASNDGTNFVDLATLTATFSGSGSILWNVSGAYYRYVKVVVTISGGSADISAFGNAK